MARSLLLALVATLMSSVGSHANADSELRLQAGSSHSTTALADPPGLVLGGSFALSRWALHEHFAFVPQLEFLFARRHLNLDLEQDGGSASDPDRWVLDTIEMPLLLRVELGRRIYALGGGYGSLLLSAQEGTDESADQTDIVHSVALSRRLAAGVIAGGGIQLLRFGASRLFVELRYQRGTQRLLDHSGVDQALTLQLGYGLRSEGLAEAEEAPLTAPLQTRRQALTFKGGLMATRLRAADDISGYSDAYQPGFWLGGALVPTRIGSWLALMPQLEVGFVHRRASAESSDGGGGNRGPPSGHLALEYVDAALLARAELSVAKTSVYALGGVYGSALVRAQERRDDTITDMRAMVSRLDAGWLAGAGVERDLFGNARLSLEVRYQHGMRDLFAPDIAGELVTAAAGDTTQQSFIGLIGIAYGQSSTASAGKRITAVGIGRPGDRWLSTIRFVRIERAVKDGERGYQVTYNIAGHGTALLFWSREDIDFKGDDRGYRHRRRSLKRGRLVYPTVLTRTSLPKVYPYILEIEAAYAAQAQGGIAAMEGFAVVVALGEGRPRLRPTRPPGSSGAGAHVTARATTARSASSLTKASRRALGRALVAAGHTRPKGAAAHHIVAGDASLAQPARDVLKKFGIGINEAVNGVFLPATRKSPNPTGAAVHSTLHTKRYFEHVNESLGRLGSRAEVEAVLADLQKRLLAGGI